MEKLAERLAYLLALHRFRSHQVAIAQVDRDFAREMIMQVLSAVRDGLELPGEVGRGEIVFGLAAGVRSYVWHRKEDRVFGIKLPFIALTGTGKEEE